jgi:hypothetical protein
MGSRVLIDGFQGDPNEFYGLVIEEVNQRSLSDVKFNWVEEAESEKRFFNKGDKAPALGIAFGDHERIVVFAYQMGNCFYMSSRITHRFGNPDNNTYLVEVLIYTFESVVNVATKRALVRHMEARRAPIPKFLVENDNVAQPAL